MISRKTAHFFGNVLRTRPFDLPDMVVRRAIEAVSTPPTGLARTRFGDVRFDVDMDLHALARKYYFHTHEMFLETVFRRMLKPGSIFVDIGANLGYWSAFAAALVGRSGEVHAFEPAPHLYPSLERLKAANPDYHIVPRNAACGAARGSIPMAIVRPTAANFDNFDTNIGSNSVLPGFLDHARGLTETIDVDMIRFDDHVAEVGLDLDRVGLIKIDVEGYESFCLDGMTDVLGRSGRRVPILCEVLTDPARSPWLDGQAVIDRFRRTGYTCLDASSLKPIDDTALAFEENLLCL